ncbi:MAG TPA: HEAT repeat domain-containing protein [Allosphingosinicella sp.]
MNRELDAAPAGEAEAILACGRRFLEEPNATRSCLDLLGSFAKKDFFFRPPLPNLSGEVHTGLLLLDRPQLTMLLAVASPDALATKRKIRRGPASIAFAGARSVYKFVKAGGATLSFWETSGPAWEGRGRCRFVERRAIEDGEILGLDGRYQGFVVDHAEGDMVYIHMSTPAGAAPLVAEYDSDSLEFIGGSSADEANSRTLMMLSLLRLMKRGDAAPLFREALGSSHFYARWHAMREYLALDLTLALPHLREMAQGDPHPEVRVAAARTLETFFSGEALGRGEELECLA